MSFLKSLASYHQLRLNADTLFVIQKRFRFKQKWATTRAKRTPKQHALAYFDTYYKPVYGELWHSMRISLLSQKKYCALANNFADIEETVVSLISDGADEFTELARRTVIPEDELAKLQITGLDNEQIAELPTEHSDDCGLDDQGDDDKTNIHSFVPVKRIMSDKEKLKEEEMLQGFYDPSQRTGFNVNVVGGGDVNIPFHLRAFTHGRGEIQWFDEPTMDSTGKLGYYLMDAASILPVLALDLHPECHVLDLCAGPGGKSLTMLQTMLPASLHCVDNSWSRLDRVRRILRYYLPSSYGDNTVELHKADGAAFCHEAKAQYDKVLVDVPCYTDRHVVKEDDNNIFRPIRQMERLQLQNIQKNLLFAAIEACKPGGTIVYSTCTLSPPQNDGVIHAVLERVWQQTQLNVVVEDLSGLARKFQNTFNFYPDCRFGQLVIPNLTANFGPMYFCKLRRLN